MGDKINTQTGGNTKMNIKEAKEQIKYAMTSYFTKDEYGEYVIPTERQRPVFLMGPPGIGKTAIMEQIASEMGVGLLSYSMIHHTRQSALGLPYIKHKEYKGMEYEISEYTMSEIIASIYDLMERTGIEEGILFLDEINCVSETLAPVMLQFLQYKVFGRHKVPEGWMIVTAGNPPEYNKSVREFDIVTWDRLKRIDVDPDYETWKSYAYQINVHPAVLSYLDIKTSDFYKVESTVDGKHFVTARGWDDLSQMLRLYEQHGIPVDVKLISQYIQEPRIARDFAAYYDLFLKYRGDYQVDEILAGEIPENVIEQAKAARFDERLSLISLLLDALGRNLRKVVEKDLLVTELLTELKAFKARLDQASDVEQPAELLRALTEMYKEKTEAAKIAGSVGKDKQVCGRQTVKYLLQMAESIQEMQNRSEAFQTVKEIFAQMVTDLKEEAKTAGEKLSNVFAFAEKVFGNGQEMVIIVTELTANAVSARFISRYGCEEYFKHNKELLFYERKQEIKLALDELNI